MDRIYSNCVLNIAAAWARSAQDGCFSARHSELVKPCTIFVRYFTETEGIHGIRSDADHKLTAVHGSPLSTRGWVLQERMLSPRVLSFGQDQVFWECRELRNGSEAYPCGFKMHLLYPIFDIPPTASQKDCRWLWDQIIRAYSSKSLSRPQADKFIALSAIARRIARLKEDTYIAGLFWKDFPAQLLWNVKHDDRFSGRTTRATGIYRAPTWSWASLDGPVEPGYYPWSDDSQMADVIKAEVTLADKRNREGQITAAQMVLRGPVAAINWSIEPPHPIFEYSGPGVVVSSLSYNSQRLNEPDNDTRSKILFDDQIYLHDDQSDVFAIPLEKRKLYIVGLILRRQVNSLEEIYTRLGIFLYWDLRVFDWAPEKTVTII
jgi:hypothetical protein